MGPAIMKERSERKWDEEKRFKWNENSERKRGILADECEGQGKRGHLEKKKIGIVKDRVMNNQKRGIKRERNEMEGHRKRD